MERQSNAFKVFSLPGGTLMPFPANPGERVRVLCGRVWLTEEGHLHDAFLAGGEEVALGGRGLAVIEALTPARIELLESRSLWNGIARKCRSALRSLGASWLQMQRRPVSACSRSL